MQIIKDTLFALLLAILIGGALALADHKENQLENHNVRDQIERDRQAAVVEARHANAQY